MQKINLKIDVSKLDKSRFKKNTFTKQDGTEVNEINAEMVLVEKNEYRTIKEGNKDNGTKWILKETHFIVEKRGKDEDSNYVGTGTQFFEVEESNQIKSVAPGYMSQSSPNSPKNTPTSDESTEEDINPDDIPFN